MNGKPQNLVKVSNTTLEVTTYWTIEKFDSRLKEMREMYQVRTLFIEPVSFHIVEDVDIICQIIFSSSILFKAKVQFICIIIVIEIVNIANYLLNHTVHRYIVLYCASQYIHYN